MTRHGVGDEGSSLPVDGAAIATRPGQAGAEQRLRHLHRMDMGRIDITRQGNGEYVLFLYRRGTSTLNAWIGPSAAFVVAAAFASVAAYQRRGAVMSA